MGENIELGVGLLIFFLLFVVAPISHIINNKGGKKKKTIKKKQQQTKKTTLDEEVKATLSNMRKTKSLITKLKKQGDKKADLALKRISDEAYAVCIGCDD